MSSLVVEVCRVDKIEPHPSADKLRIATIKGWQTCIGYNPETDTCQFNEGDYCIYFPPDSVLPPKLYHDRLNIGKYLKSIPKNADGSVSDMKRVAATRLRGVPSYGFIAKIDPTWGDDLTWEIGTNLIDYFGITKYEPPVEDISGDTEIPHIRFHQYTKIEHLANFPDSFQENEEVIFTEKIHGSNVRIGSVLDCTSSGQEIWSWVAGSHSVRRKEFQKTQTRFKVSKLIEKNFVSTVPSIGQIFFDHESKKHWKVEEVIPINEKSNEPEVKVQVVLVDETGNLLLKQSSFWFPLTSNMKNLINDVKKTYSIDNEIPNSIIVFGEIYGSGVQDMTYGLDHKSFRAFDISINNKYMDYDFQLYFFKKHKIETVPILYRGPFSIEKVKEFTSGPTTLCSPELAGSFKGREGIVIRPIREKHFCNILSGRKITKSISADYIARDNGTEFH